MSMIDDPECQVLGALLCEPSYQFQIQEVISDNDFSVPKHQLIFKTILGLGDNADIFTVSSELEGVENYGVDIGYLVDLQDICMAPKNILAYAKLVLEKARIRKLKSISAMIEESIFNKDKSESILDSVGEALSLIGTSDTNNTQKTLNEALKEAMEQVDDRANGKNEVYKTGFQELDEYMPFEGGSLYLLGGLSGSGKTTLLQSFIETQIFDNIPVYFNSAEMSAAQVAKRFIQSSSSVHSGFFKNPNVYSGSDPGIGSRLTAGLKKLKDRNLLIDDEQGLTIQALKVRARNWITSQDSYQKTGKAMLAIDYAQLLDYDHRNSSTSLGKISKEARALGKELGIPVILLVQLNQDHKNRSDKRPVPSDIAGSAEMYRDSDGVIFAYRDETHNPDTPDAGIMEIVMGKNRDGAQGSIRAVAEMKYFRVRDIQTPQI